MDNKIDLVVSFDTTGSMYPVLSQVRQEVTEFVKSMFSEFTDLRLGVIAHGDYCDKDKPYTIRVMDLTRDEKELVKFVNETKSTFGGDADECYELVLNTTHKVLNWRDDAQKVLIMIGDAAPHGVNYPQNTDKLDWREEAVILSKNDIKVFAVHALANYRSSSRAFYKTVAETTMGCYLTLNQFNEIIDLIKATCYQQGGEEKLNEYISIIRDNGKLTKSMDNNFRRLRGEEVEDEVVTYTRRTATRRAAKKSGTEAGAIKEMEELVPVLAGRFQVMTVDKDCAIKEFVTSNGIEFKKGRGFYELSKAETVQQYKEVIMQDLKTGEMFNGTQVREKLGLSPQTESGGVNERIHASAAAGMRVFVQSTSVNRKLIGGTTFLYEVGDLEDAGTVIDETVIETPKKDKETEKMATKTAKKETKAPAKKEVAKAPAKKAPVEKKAATKKEVAKAPAKATVEKKAPAKKAPAKAAVETKAPAKKAPATVEFKEINVKGIKKPAVDESKKVITEKKVVSDKLLSKLTKAQASVALNVDKFNKSSCPSNTVRLTKALENLENSIKEIKDSIK